MYNTTRISHALVVLLALVLSLSSLDALGSPRRNEAAEQIKEQKAAHRLERLGYQLTERDLNRALQKRDVEALQPCLDYAVRKGFTALVPAIRKWRDSLDLKLYYKRCMWFRFTAALYALDNDIPEDALAKELTEIRKAIFQKKVKSVPIAAYMALLAAGKYKGVDIEEDLRHLAKTTIMGRVSGDGVILDLFERYGDRQDQDTVKELLAAWPDRPERRALITRCAAKAGIVAVEAETPR